jgi:hypothetical protein
MPQSKIVVSGINVCSIEDISYWLAETLSVKTGYKVLRVTRKVGAGAVYPPLLLDMS